MIRPVLLIYIFVFLYEKCEEIPIIQNFTPFSEDHCNLHIMYSLRATICFYNCMILEVHWQCSICFHSTRNDTQYLYCNTKWTFHLEKKSFICRSSHCVWSNSCVKGKWIVIVLSVLFCTTSWKSYVVRRWKCTTYREERSIINVSNEDHTKTL